MCSLPVNTGDSGGIVSNIHTHKNRLKSGETKSINCSTGPPDPKLSKIKIIIIFCHFSEIQINHSELISDNIKMDELRNESDLIL